MAQTKYTDAGQQQRVDRLTSLRETRKDLSELAGLKLSPEWGKLTRLLKRWADFARNEEKRANAEHDAEEIDAIAFSKRVTRARQKAADFEFVAEILEKTKQQLETVDDEIARLEKAFKSAKEVLA